MGKEIAEKFLDWFLVFFNIKSQGWLAFFISGPKCYSKKVSRLKKISGGQSCSSHSLKQCFST
jgi:hypothetical protein